LGLPTALLLKVGGIAALFMKTPCGFDQGTWPALMGNFGGITFAWARTAFRLRLINNAATTPTRSSPISIATPAPTSSAFDELLVGVPVLLPPLLPDVVPPFVTGVWLLAAVEDALTVGVVPVVAVALAVVVTVGVTPCVGEGVGGEVGDGLGVGEGGTTGAW